MPRYFFHVRSPDEFIQDEEGMDLASLDDVRVEARESAKGLLQEAIAEDRVVDGQAFEVTDEAGRLVMTYPFKDAIRLS